jgi:hypothetical protein
VNGLGGHPWIYEINGPDCTPVAGSQIRYNSAHGILLGIGSSSAVDFCFYSTEADGRQVDSFSVSATSQRR